MPSTISSPAGMMVPIIPPHLLILPTQLSPLRAITVATQYIARTVTKVKILLDANAASDAPLIPM